MSGTPLPGQRTHWAWTYALLSILLVAGWQWATVTANFGGNWSALFCTGGIQRQPPIAAAEHIYLFANSNGYDGQQYHYIAHDPFLRSDLKSYVDDPRLRYRRIFVPLLAYVLAFGQSSMIDVAYGIVCLLSIGLGVYWSCLLAQRFELAPAWGLVFLAMPATQVTADRLVIDGTMAALMAAFLYYCVSPSWKLFVVLSCAVLTRETGFLLVAAYCGHLVSRRAFSMVGVSLMSIVPAAAWYGYVQANTTAQPYGGSLLPFSSILWVLRNPWQYPPGTPFAGAVQAADYLALAGVLFGFGLVIAWFVQEPSIPLRIAAMLFAAMGLLLQRNDHWQNVYDYGRVYTPVLLCIAASAGEYRKPFLLFPIVMMAPRLAMQLTPQVLGVIRWFY